MLSKDFQRYFLFPTIVGLSLLIYLILLFSGTVELHIGSKCNVKAKVDMTIDGEDVDYVETHC